MTTPASTKPEIATVYREVRSDLYRIFVPENVVPRNIWIGPKISLIEWSKVIAFMRWSQLKHRSEAMMQMFMCPRDNKIMFWAFPQNTQGMTVHEIAGEEYNKQRAENIPVDAFPCGSIHHHCVMSAFQSGTDKHDEDNRDGIHMTLGKVEDVMMDLHIRIVDGKHHSENIDLSSLFEDPEILLHVQKQLGLSRAEYSQLLTRYLLSFWNEAKKDEFFDKPDGQFFPPIWRTNIRKTYTSSGAYSYTGYQANLPGIAGTSATGGGAVPFQKGKRKKTKTRKTGATTAEEVLTDADNVAEDVAAYLSEHNSTSTIFSCPEELQKDLAEVLFSKFFRHQVAPKASANMAAEAYLTIKVEGMFNHTFHFRGSDSGFISIHGESLGTTYMFSVRKFLEDWITGEDNDSLINEIDTGQYFAFLYLTLVAFMHARVNKVRKITFYVNKPIVDMSVGPSTPIYKQLAEGYNFSDFNEEFVGYLALFYDFFLDDEHLTIETVEHAAT